MKTAVRSGCFLILLTVLLTGAPVWAESMSLKDCVKEALKQNEQLKAANYEVEARLGQRNSIRGHFLPVIGLEANAVFWDKEQVFDMSSFESMFGGLNGILGGFMGVFDLLNPKLGLLLNKEDQAKLADLMKGINESAASLNQPQDPMKLRNKITYGFTTTIGQPLTGLYKIYAGYKANDELVEAAKLDRVTVAHKLEQDVSTAYIGLISAVHFRETAKAGMTQIEAIEKQVQAYLDAQMVEKNAMFKVQLQKAEIQKGLLQAENGVKLATAALNMYMNRPLDTPIEPDMNIEVRKMDTAAMDKLQNDAVSERPEMVSARHQVEAARMGKHAAIGAMLPDINLFFKYENSQGTGALTPEHQYYGGFALSWNVWEWGASYYLVKEAEARYAQASATISNAQDMIKLDVKSKGLALEEAQREVAVAKAAQEQAEENLRVEKARYEVQETTTTDLLAAQTQKLKAENDLIVARMKERSAQISLLLGVGQDLAKD